MSKKKILTLTTQYSPNMGALLQCYALSRYLNSQSDTECAVIQYWHPNAKAGWSAFKHRGGLRNMLFNIYMFFRPDLIMQKKRRNKKLQAFIDEYIPLDEKKYTTDDAIRQDPPQADVYVVGSDQIWNVNRKGVGTVYFFDFVPDGKRRVAYAPSLGVDWSEQQKTWLRPYLQKFDALSVREEGHVAQVEEASGKPVAHVADPVFLLSPEEWLKIAKKPPFEEPYIFCYFFGVTDLAARTVQRLREVTGYKVVYMNFNALDKLHSDVCIRSCDPRDFIGYIANAAVVCASSFHASAFSIIFKKNLFYVPQAERERILSLRRTFKIDDILVTEERLTSLTKENIHIDYSKGEKAGKEYISYSRDFLLNSIYEKQS